VLTNKIVYNTYFIHHTTALDKIHKQEIQLNKRTNKEKSTRTDQTSVIT